jgi:epsin
MEKLWVSLDVSLKLTAYTSIILNLKSERNINFLIQFTRFRNNTPGGMYRPGSHSSIGSCGDRYEEDRYASREEDRNGYGYGREREMGSRDDDRYNRDGDRYGRDYEERYGRDGYRDDDRGRSRSVDYNYDDTRSRNSDRDRDFDDDGQHSSR